MGFRLTRTDRFPVGTEVSAYATDGRERWSPKRGGTRGRPRTKPPGPPVATETMTSDGATFSLPRGRYFFAAEIDGEWRIVAGGGSG